MVEALTVKERMTAHDTNAIDVVVIGAGPGGCAAAISCAQAGLRVALVERELFPKEHPGETLHPGVEPLLRKLGVWERVLSAGFLRHKGIWVEWNGKRRFEPYGSDKDDPWRGLQAWRADLHSILLRRAHALGVEVLQPCRALRPCVEGGRVVGVEASRGALRAAFLVDAGGGRHWLARQLGIKIEHHSVRLLAQYGYAVGECPIRDEAPAIMGEADGWTWTARVRPQLYGWTRLLLGYSTFDANYLPDEFRGLETWGTTRGANVTWRIAAAPAGPGYFLVGDAAAVLDPASSHGVLKAIMSGMLAAQAIAQTVQHQVQEDKAVEAYGQWVRSWFMHDVERLRELYAVLPERERPHYV
jgi:flavin-dependent dehydrogenase